MRCLPNRAGGISSTFAKCCVFALILTGFAALCVGQRRARTPMRVVQLSQPQTSGSLSVEEAFAKQEPVARFSGQTLDLSKVGQLAWAGQRAVSALESEVTPGAAGGQPALQREDIYSVRLYFALPSGTYLYDADAHGLEQTSDADVRVPLAQATRNPPAVSSAACNVLLLGSTRALARRGGTAGRNLLLLHAGHVAQNVQLQAVSLELGSVTIGDFDSRAVKRVCNVSRNLEPLYIISVGQPAPEGSTAAQPAGARPNAAALVIPSQDFRDEELFETRRVLDAAGVATTVASTRTGPVRGMLGGIVQVGLRLDQLQVGDYGAIIFVGGPGASQYYRDPIALNVVREAIAKGRILGATSTAPTILGNAGVLRGIRVTAFFSEQAALQQAGALYSGAAVERDGLVITAIGPLEAPRFGQAIAAALAGR